jgi:hypothetical protein
VPKKDDMLLLITYDLHKPERDYQAVFALIQRADSCVRVEESVWIVDTEDSPTVWRNQLKAVTTEATFFVIRLRKSWAGFKLHPAVAVWLESDERRW